MQGSCTIYDDLQIIIRETFNPVTFNGGEAHIDGVEVELTWVPTEQWFITAAVGWIDAEYDQLSDEVLNSATPVLSTAVGVACTFVEQVYGRPREWWLSLKYIF